MPKAKKKKVAVTETAEIITAIEEEFENTGPTGEEQVAPAPVIEPELAPAESPRRARIKKIGKFVILLAESAAAAQLRATEAEEQEKLATRLYKAKEKRWNSVKNNRGQRKLRRPGMVGCRIFEAIIALQDARLKRLATRCDAAVADTKVASMFSRMHCLERGRLRSLIASL